ncbi:MAG: FAD-dependent oxidoreductase [Spirochaetia bacterium]
MKKEFRKMIELDDSWDVVVAGGGPAGCAAAISAADAGCRTLLLESTGILGGMGTSGLVPGWAPYYRDGGTSIYGGLSWKIFDESRKGQAHVKNDDYDWVSIDHEKLKVIYDTRVAGSGAKILFNTFVTDAVAVNKESASGMITVDYIIISNKNGIRGIKGKVFVDATGDGDLAVWAGAPFEKGGLKNDLQPATHCFILSNVDTFAYQTGDEPNHTNIHGRVYRIAKDPKYPLAKDGHFCNNLLGPGSVGFNAGHIWGVDNTDPESVSDALRQGRLIARELTEALKDYYPKAFGNSFLSATAPMLGVRETRRITGDYIITINDFLERKKFNDDIGRNAYPVDIHTAADEIDENIKGKVQGIFRYEHYSPGETHGIPYRSLVPKNLSNVLTAGRCISTDRDVNGSVRVMPVALVTGEAAGNAAAMAAEGTGAVRSINVGDLQEKLRKAGAYLPDLPDSANPGQLLL